MSESATLEDVKDFITDCEKKRENFLLVADRSWREIKRRNKKGRLVGGDDLNGRTRRWVNYPLWWTAFEIRKPITLSRLPIPKLKDTQSDDPYGRTACIQGERLINGILKTFDALPVFCSGRDDFLVTDFGWNRAFYKCEIVQEEEKVRLEVIEQEPMEGPDGQIMEVPPIFQTPDGERVVEPLFDDLGPYILSGKMVDVEDEQVYLDHSLYSDLLVDPDARRWSQVKRLAYRYEYSYRDFKATFGQKALDKLVQADIDEFKTGTPIVVYEYWDYYTREVKWLAENSDDFFQPKAMPGNDSPADLEFVKPKDKAEYADEDRADSSDIYGLSDFFPQAPPLLLNAPTDEFWPIPQYFQVMDILNDVHNIASRMFLLTRAIRVRFLYDSSVPELTSLAQESDEADGLGVANLSDALIAGKGTLATLVQYFPVEELIVGLDNMYKAFSQRLEMFYQATGLNDLIRGATSDVEKTYGERQMEGKYAMNRMEPYQRQVQEWIKNSYQILMEMGLKNFSDKTLDEYIVPQTMDPEDKERYTASLELLKSNRRRRFRVDFETDATIHINQEYQKAQAIETANTITKMVEAIANSAEAMPEIVTTELKVAMHVVGELTDGKEFKDEILSDIQEVIDRITEKQQEEPPPDPEVELKKNAQMLDYQFKNIQLQADSQIKMATLQQKDRQDAIKTQLEQIRLQLEQGVSSAEIQIALTKVQAEIQQGAEALELKRAELMQIAQAEGGKSEMDAFALIIDERLKQRELQLREGDQQIEATRAQLEARDNSLSLQERVATEQRLQTADLREAEAHQVDVVARLAEVAAKAAEPPPEPKAAPITVDKSTTIHIKPPAEKPKKKPKK